MALKYTAFILFLLGGSKKMFGRSAILRDCLCVLLMVMAKINLASIQGTRVWNYRNLEKKYNPFFCLLQLR